MPCFLLFCLATGFPGEAYQPLKIPVGPVTTLDLSFKDQKRSRDLPLKIHLGPGTDPRPVILFSHGLGGSRNMGGYLGKHWAARGYLVVFTQHPGSDESVWKDKRPLERMSSLKQAANPEQFLQRVKDIPAILDQLSQWNQQKDHPLCGKLDLAHVGMSGHSFGGLTTQAVSGQLFPLGIKYTDPRIKAALVMSPSPAKGPGGEQKAFAKVAIPWMLMTGTRDNSPIGDIDPLARQKVFPALPPGGKYELVLDGGQHSAFTDRPLPGEDGSRNPNHHRVILALSTAFWDAHLKGDRIALSWLNGEGPASILEKGDRFLKK